MDRGLNFFVELLNVNIKMVFLINRFLGWCWPWIIADLDHTGLAGSRIEMRLREVNVSLTQASFVKSRLLDGLFEYLGHCFYLNVEGRNVLPHSPYTSADHQRPTFSSRFNRWMLSSVLPFVAIAQFKEVYCTEYKSFWTQVTLEDGQSSSDTPIDFYVLETYKAFMSGNDYVNVAQDGMCGGIVHADPSAGCLPPTRFFIQDNCYPKISLEAGVMTESMIHHISGTKLCTKQYLESGDNCTEVNELNRVCLPHAVSALPALFTTFIKKCRSLHIHEIPLEVEDLPTPTWHTQTNWQLTCC